MCTAHEGMLIYSVLFLRLSPGPFASFELHMEALVHVMTNAEV